MSTKLTRRDVMKILGAAGAFLVAQPQLSKISTLAEAAPNRTDYTSDTNEPLVVLVRDGQLIGFRGTKEFVVKDADLAAKLGQRFGL